MFCYKQFPNVFKPFNGFWMQQRMTDDGMESTKEIPCHLVLLIVCWHHDLQIPVHVAFERMCKYLSLPLSLKVVNMFGRKSMTKISYVQRKKKGKSRYTLK